MRKLTDEELLKFPKKIVDTVKGQMFLPLEDEKKNHLSEVAKQLHNRGIAESSARSLSEKHPEEYIRKKIEVFDFLKDSGSDLILENPAVWLWRAIEEDYELSDEPQNKQKVDEKKQAAEDQRGRWLVHREKLIARELRDWDKTPREERVKGVFNFWLKVIYRGDPHSEETEAKKQEYIDGLPQTDEEKRKYIRTKVVSFEPPDDFE